LVFKFVTSLNFLFAGQFHLFLHDNVRWCDNLCRF